MNDTTAQSKLQSTSLKDQVAVVTGGGRGIGRAIAQALAAAGARVAVIARSQNELAETAALIQQAGGHAQLFVADVSVPESVRGAIQAVERALGPVDLLVNNAAAIKPFGPSGKTISTSGGAPWRSTFAGRSCAVTAYCRE
jgi:Short-chain alcohol dehydrogenase of unknown specificity